MLWIASILTLSSSFLPWMALLCVAYLYTKRRSLPLPPGPKRLPLLGNILNAPTSFAWLDYARWCKEFGTDILYLWVPGTSIIVIHTYEAAIELLEKRSSLYSSRPPSPMIVDLMGWDFNYGFSPYGDRWRAQRRRAHQVLKEGEEMKYYHHILDGRDDFLHRLLTDPADFLYHIRYTAGSFTLKVTYGLDIKGTDDYYVTLAERAVGTLLAAAVPGTFLVDQIPILKYVPAWFPGAGFKRKAAIWAEDARAMVNSPYEAGKKIINSGVATPSLQSESLNEIDNIEDESVRAYEEEVLRGVTATMYGASADTTSSTMATFFLAMTLHPNVQHKAHEELAKVLPKGVLPSIDDEESLPYVTAIVREVLRWKPVTPFGVPHYSEADDIYDGYHLPAKSVVIANIWAMLHEEAVYSKPEMFNPDRFILNGKLDPSARNPTSIAFGFGRRVCQGRYLAYKATWTLIASVLTTFEISKAVNPETGEEIQPSEEYIPSLVVHPKPFKCDIKPRSEETERLVRGLKR